MGSEGENTYKAYRVSTIALEILLQNLTKKIEYLSKANRWAELEQPDTKLGPLDRLLEEPFEANYCLISGLESHRTPKGTESQRQMAVEGM